MHSQQKETIETILANRHYLYQVLTLIFGSEPTTQLLEALSSPQTKDTLELFSREDNDSVMKLASFFQEIPQKMAHEEYVDALKSEYTRLFIGPDKLPAYPWESVYVGKESMLFQESTLNVRKFYAQFGYRALAYKQVADDHIGLMMNFMSNMSRDTYTAFCENDYEKTLELLSAQQDFINTHMLNWIPAYAEAIKKVADVAFYNTCVAALCTILKTDDIFLSETQLIILRREHC